MENNYSSKELIQNYKAKKVHIKVVDGETVTRLGVEHKSQPKNYIKSNKRHVGQVNKLKTLKTTDAVPDGNSKKSKVQSSPEPKGTKRNPRTDSSMVQLQK